MDLRRGGIADLRYRWGDAAPQASPASPRDATVALWVGDRVVWQGDVTEELWAWARWCALRVADLWGCPEGGQHFLRTGGERHRDAAAEAASRAVGDAFRGPVWRVAWDAPWFYAHYTADAVAGISNNAVTRGIAGAIRRATAPAAARMHAAEDACRLVWRAATAAAHAASRDEACLASCLAADHAARAMGMANDSLAARHAAEVAQADRLRRLLLQRALPRPRWGLIHRDEATESVLCDALLELRGRG